jgi:HlyD family secretion protein
MQKKKILPFLSVILLLGGCDGNQFNHDASGIFEATEITVSALTAGRVESFALVEGETLAKDVYLGYVDTAQLHYQRLQLHFSIDALEKNLPDVKEQLAVVEEQINKAKKELDRVKQLHQENAATEKNLDDAATQLEVLHLTYNSQATQLNNARASLLSQIKALKMQESQVEDQIAKSLIVSPVDGVVLKKYVEEKEAVAPGSPLFKIADTERLFLKAYVTSAQLTRVKVGDSATVSVNCGESKQTSVKGTVVWISSKAEFTPKTIQTQDERENLVYAVKIAVRNSEGLLKIGMYGDVDFVNP